MFDVEVDDRARRNLEAAIADEQGGKKLRADLGANMVKVLNPVLPKIKAGLMSMGTAGLPHAGAPLRATVLRQLRSDARVTPKAASATIRIRKVGMPRRFPNAPKRLNADRGWRRMVYGQNVWVRQVGKPGYFDRPIRTTHAQLRAGCVKAMDDMARRIARKAHTV